MIRQWCVSLRFTHPMSLARTKPGPSVVDRILAAPREQVCSRLLPTIDLRAAGGGAETLDGAAIAAVELERGVGEIEIATDREKEGEGDEEQRTPGLVLLLLHGIRRI